MRASASLIAICVLMLSGAALAQTKPTQPLGPVPSGGGEPVKPTDGGTARPTRGVLYIPQFAPPGTQVPGGPPASNTPTLIGPTVLGIR